MGSWLLLGTDSLIACIAVGPIMSRRLSVLVPFALLFGVGDGLGYLLGCALHWSFPDNLSFLAPVVVAVIGVYWIAVAIVSRKAAAAEENPKAHWGVDPAVATEPRQHHLRHGRRRFPWRLDRALGLRAVRVKCHPGRRRSRDRHRGRVRDPGGAAPHVGGQRSRRRRHARRGRRPVRRRLSVSTVPGNGTAPRWLTPSGR